MNAVMKKILNFCTNIQINKYIEVVTIMMVFEIAKYINRWRQSSF